MVEATAPIRILHLEGHPRDAELIRDKLELVDQACAIVLVDNREQYDAMLADRAFDLILCDYNLPRYDGLSALKLARQRQPDTPVIMISGSTDEGEAVKCLQLGATDYLLKQQLERFIPAVYRALQEADEVFKHRQAEVKLIRSRNLHRVAGQMARMGGWEVDLSTGRLILSDEAASLIGAPLDTSLAADDVVDFYAPEYREKIRTAFQACICDGTSFDVEFEVVTFQDRRIWIRWMGQAVRDRDGTLTGVHGAFQDITEKKQAEQALNQSNKKLTSTLESITDAFFTLDRKWRFTYVNKEGERLLQRARAELLNMVVWEEFKEAVGSSFYHEYHRAVRDSCTVMFEEFYGPLGCWVEVHCYPSEEGLTVYFRDISERKRHEAELEYRATHDALTRLPNHGLLQNRLLQAITLANREQWAAAVLIVDFGRFQIVNDTVGREAADQMLCQMAGRLQALFCKGETVARQGGDEFVVVVEQVEGEQHCAELAGLIMQAMATPFVAANKEFYASSSIGIALYPKHGTTTAELLKNADAAMGQAKQLGRNNFQFYTATMNERARLRLVMETALREALERDEFVLHYQPQVDLQTGAVVGVETLIRWQHPELGLILPDRFIALAEDTGLIVPIGTWVLRTACAQASAWQRTGIGNLRVAVNLSASQFAQPDFACMIASVLNETGLAATMLDLELTESLVMTDVECTISVLNELRALGVRLSIDDFGTGYSSLSYLKRFPIDVLKIDRSFVKDISQNTNDAAISKAIISMAHTLGIRVIAEGVETEAQCEFLSQNMCDEIQGYLFSAPLPASELDVLLQENRQLPQHLLRLHKPLRTLLLVDDEPNILSALKRLLRRDSYNILTAASGKEGLELLAKQEIDVIVSDQRMPGMTGVDFLRTVKTLHPDTVRIVLSGFTELQSVTDAVNEGAIYKFLTKPWDDNQLREHVAQAFHHKEMVDENRRLTLEVQTANHHLATANRQLEDVLEQKQQQITRGKVSLDIVREALQHIPLPVFGLDEDGIVAFVNVAAEELYADTGPILGGEAAHLMPKLMHAIRIGAEGEKCKIKLNGLWFEAVSRSMGNGTQSRGKLIVLSPCDAE
ncbi:MAG: hypothetical protein JWM30_1454 [Burkholderia sp.]|nr:hypothetical protein [Burkholderia sp.]